YRKFKLDQPWDSPDNKKLLERIPWCYRTGFGGDDSLTHYQVFVGPGTAFERPGLTWADFPDGLGATLLVVEGGEPVPWSKPADVVYDPGQPPPPLGAGFSKSSHFLCYEVSRRAGFNAVFADGSAHFISDRTDEQTVRGLITRNGGETVDPSRLD